MGLLRPDLDALYLGRFVIRAAVAGLNSIRNFNASAGVSVGGGVEAAADVTAFPFARATKLNDRPLELARRQHQ